MSPTRKCSLLIAMSAVLSMTIDAAAQSCAMCYASAAASQKSGISALQHGILILLIPPLLIFAGICVAAFRRPNRCADEVSSRGHEDPLGKEP